ncbi:MAG: cystathionine beta-lyase [Xanthobacteraceae bacterium]
MAGNDDKAHKQRSVLIHAGRPASGLPTPVNPPLVRASTYLHATAEEMRATEQRRLGGAREDYYGRRGTGTSFQLEDLLTELEGGHGARLASSGLAANTLVFLAFLRPGDHLLISDGVYAPVKRFVKSYLSDQQIAFDYVRADGSGIEGKIRSNTKLIYLENPGSVLFELVDIPAIAAIANPKGIVVAVDSTWASGVTHHPIRLGADISVLSATKYLCGASDVILGAAVANESAWKRLNETADWLGTCASPDDCYQVLRGARSAAIRIEEHRRQAMRLIEWFAGKPFVRKIYYPELEDHPRHEIWKRDFTGSCGLFTVEFRGVDAASVDRFVNSLSLFGLGSSWGGFESLVRVENERTIRSIDGENYGPLVRFHAGFEDIRDLIADLDAAAVMLGKY